MKIPNSELLLPSQFDAYLLHAREAGWTCEYLADKHQLLFNHEGNWMSRIFLPWNRSWQEDVLSPIDNFHWVLTAIKAGQAVLGYFQEDQLLEHKVFRAYMVRQKQGKSQIKHLKTKGKSRAGSRIRLNETERFFEEINERLVSLDDAFPISVFGLSCSKTLWPYFFGSETPPPFDSKSTLLRSIPVHFHQASFEELTIAGQLLLQFHLLKNPEVADEIQPQMDDSDIQEEDNW
ncbi:hypothetical protein [Algoriphagus vanfongensis]|uniref:hypothetical protein n=1 Tax=Algoriphagus vanfongensis TaxID=426371 RepID=UPI00040C91D8|nr:hypothetical protein [Algoriphagus vanfongensis]